MSHLFTLALEPPCLSVWLLHAPPHVFPCLPYTSLPTLQILNSRHLACCGLKTLGFECGWGEKEGKILQFIFDHFLETTKGSMHPKFIFWNHTCKMMSKFIL